MDAAKETDPLLKVETAGRQHRSGWLRELSSAVGTKFLIAIFMIKSLYQSLALTMTFQTSEYIYRWYGVSGPDMQIYNTVVCFPQAMLPLLTLVSDSFPVGGMRFTPYMIMATILGAPAMLAVGALPKEVLGVTGLVICFMMTNLQYTTCDALSCASYMKKISEQPAHGTAMVTYVKMGQLVFGFLGTMLSGFIVASAGARVTYVCAFPLAVMVLVPLCSGWLGESKIIEADTQKMRSRFEEHPEICMLVFTICGGALVMTTIGFVSADALVCSVAAACVLLLVVFSLYLWMEAVVAKFLIYILISNASLISTRGAAYYFFTDTPKQFPDGPHFSSFFYLTVMRAVGLVFGLVGTIWYVRHLRSWTFRGLILLTVLAQTISRGMDALMFSLASRDLGIPDSVFVLSENVIEPVLDAWRLMPLMILSAHICPQGMEGTLNGLRLSAYYIGSSAASFFGSLLLERLNCAPRGQWLEMREFRLLWIASIVSMVSTFVIGVGFLWLLPDLRQDAVTSPEKEADLA